MALEQTMNVEAKSRLKGFVAFADISTAVNRWIVTGSMRSQIVNSLLEVTDLKSYNSDNKELNKPRMERDNKDVDKIKEFICATTNPFKKGINKDALFNLKMGEQASESTETFLLSVFYLKVKKKEIRLFRIVKKMLPVLKGQSREQKS